MLLGKIHVALLKLLLLDVEKEMAAGLIPRGSKDGRFLGFLQFVSFKFHDILILSDVIIIFLSVSRCYMMRLHEFSS